jgi:hypothetical protein
MAGDVRLWAIYERPRDMPEIPFVVRGFSVRGSEIVPDSEHRVADDLEGARGQLPATADVNLGRQPNDDPKIVETWMQ